MQSYEFLLILAVILLSTKVFGLISERVHMPQVVGALLAGVVLGPSVLGLVEETDFLLKTSEIGVILLMFMAGLDTDLEELKKTGLASFVIALIGVVVPLIAGTGLYLVFFPDMGEPLHMLKALFIGVVLTATSVSITVETLREMGRLKGKVGTAILGAAIIDDIMGIIVLTLVSAMTDPTVQPIAVLGRIAAFFILVVIVGFVMYRLFRAITNEWSNHRRIAIYALSFCLILSFVAEHYFGIADITGAYFAGLILCNLLEAREYINKKVNILAYMFFSPVFFASMGIKTELDGMTGSLLIFSFALLAVAIITKIVGCGLGAKLMGFNWSDSLSIGLGMVSRGEVALIVAQKGAQVGLIDSLLFPPIVLVVIVTTLITPILLKLFMKSPGEGTPPSIRHDFI
ncbi:MAG: cation:proton antiporter [Butyricicoccus pullicaecorum]|nr:cation:proton antiporter [Butyricicoccus pullicaecorum]